MINVDQSSVTSGITITDRDNAASTNDVILELAEVVRVREAGGVCFTLRVPSLVLQRGSFIAIVGESGCGKSTLLDMLGLVLKPTAAERFRIRDGDSSTWCDIMQLWEANREDALARLRREYIGYVLQAGGLFAFLSVRENVLLPARLKGNELAAGAVQQLADNLGIGHLLEKKPQFLSGGQRQRAAIMRALLHSPTVVLADEPTAAVDKERARKIVRDFEKRARELHATIIMVTHDSQLVESVADAKYAFRLQTISENETESECFLEA